MNAGNTLTPYNLVVVVALVVLAGLAAIVFVLGNGDQASRFVTFATPIVVALVGIISVYQNATNHAENRAALQEAVRAATTPPAVVVTTGSVNTAPPEPVMPPPNEPPPPGVVKT